MITLKNVQKAYGPQVIFEDATLQINAGDRLALVGPNGSGKSTLLKLILGAEEADGGDIALKSGITLGYLPQETAAFSGNSVLEEVLTGRPGANGQQEAKAKTILAGLGFRQTDFTRPVMELSGGWRMRAAIARLLVEGPDLLLLDEPTNHLDLESLLWFQNYLQNTRGALFLVSHDREFINSMARRIVEVRKRKLRVYTGTFEDYLAQRQREEESLLDAWKRQQKEIAETEEFIRRFRAKASIASRVQAKIKQLEKMERIELPEELKTVGFSFPQPARSGHNVLVLKGARQSYDGRTWVYDGLDLTLERGQRIALIGPNGAGKSTLLKMLGGVLPLQGGQRQLGHQVEAGYFSQHRPDMFQAGRTVLEEAMDIRSHLSEQTIRTVLGSFLFRGRDVFKKVDVLSGGEKSRLGLAKLLLDPPNLLLLDEPTTHLDIASVEVLLCALKAYEGTIVFISHDVYFIRQLASHILHIRDGRVRWYPGDYDYFLHKKTLEQGEEAELFRSEERIERGHQRWSPPRAAWAVAPVNVVGDRSSKDMMDSRRGYAGMTTGASPKSKEQKRLEAEERKARFLLEQERRRREQVRKQLQDAEALILNELARPATHQDPKRVVELSIRLSEIQKQLK